MFLWPLYSQPISFSVWQFSNPRFWAFCTFYPLFSSIPKAFKYFLFTDKFIVIAKNLFWYYHQYLLLPTKILHEHLKYSTVKSKCGSPTLSLFLSSIFLISVIHRGQNSGYHLVIHHLSHSLVKHLPCLVESTKLHSCACWICDPSPAPALSKSPLSLGWTK